MEATTWCHSSQWWQGFLERRGHPAILAVLICDRTNPMSVAQGKWGAACFLAGSSGDLQRYANSRRAGKWWNSLMLWQEWSSICKSNLMARLEEDQWWLVLSTSSNEDITWSLQNMLQTQNVGGRGFNLNLGQDVISRRSSTGNTNSSTPPSLPYVRLRRITIYGMLRCHHRIPCRFF